MRYTATNIRLPRKTLDALKLEAVKRRTSLAQLIREAVEATYGIASEAPALDRKTDPFYRQIGSIAGGSKDLSDKHDDIYSE